MRSQLKSITIKGFKTIRELIGFEPGALSVLIGPNGAGKSNFIAFFRMLGWALASSGTLKLHLAEHEGGASAILHDGPAKTREIEAEITIVTDKGENQYAIRLVFAAGDTLIYADEKFRFSDPTFGAPASWTTLGAGHAEPQIIARAATDKTAKVILRLLRKIIVYQFHNTSDSARIRNKWDSSDNRWLKEDGANIAPLLRRLREERGEYYARIVETIRRILPFFADFELEPDRKGALILSWREQNSDRVFSAAQGADGMLRVMALTTLLLQPDEDLPDVLILDEPELGLHPYAMSVMAGLIQGVSRKAQVIIATQSAQLIDYFKPQDVVVVERKGRESTFRRLKPEALQDWLQDYSLSELWEKNVIGGRP